MLPIVERERQAATAAERRLQAAQDAFDGVPVETPTDAMLDFGTALQEAIRGRVDPAGSMAEVNEALRELFACFLVKEEPATCWNPSNPFEPHPDRTEIVIQPWLRAGAVAPPSDPELGLPWPLVAQADDDPPPLRWLQAPADPTGNVQNSQAYRPVSVGRSLQLPPLELRL